LATEEWRTLKAALEEAKACRDLPSQTLSRLSDVFGDKLGRALEAVDQGRVMRFVFNPSRRILWVVSGRGGEYLVLPNAGFCSCEDFYFRVISHEESLCYHILAQKLAEVLNRYTTKEDTDEEYHTLVTRLAIGRVRPRKLAVEEVENLRMVVVGVLAEEGEMTLDQLLDAVRGAGFQTVTKRHLANILLADKAERFARADGRWSLRQPKG
jgi:predicted nucleic acid-binding Zn finger protein